MGYEQRFVITKTEEGDIKGGKAIRDALSNLNTGRYTLVLKRYNKGRSTSQNSFYHAVVIPYVLDGLVDVGYERHNLSNNLVHEMLKAKFLKFEMVSHNGEPIEMIKSTSELTTVEFMAYMEDIAKFCSEFLGIILPEPDEQLKLIK